MNKSTKSITSSNGKKAQIQFTFNWIYILIAGMVILIFFVSIVAKQKTSSEEHLNAEVVRVMESIFTASGVSEKTKNFIEKKILSKKLTDKKRENSFREALKEIEQYAAAGFPDFKKTWDNYGANSIYDLMENIDNKLKTK